MTMLMIPIPSQMPMLRTAKPAYKGARPEGTPAFRLSPIAETQRSSKNVPTIWNISDATFRFWQETSERGRFNGGKKGTYGHKL